MEFILKHIENIKSYFGKIGFIVSIPNKNFKDGQLDLIINIDKENINKDCWGYFARILSESIEHLELTYTDTGLSFYFGIYTDLDKAVKDLFIFYTLSTKRYYEVSPQVQAISLLVKPTHRCNLNCKYCYDRRYIEKINTDMNFEMVDLIFDKISKYSRKVIWIWHGGEPTLMGTRWYEYIYENILPKYPMLEVKFQMMSNGIKLNNKWLEHCKKYKVFIGVSFSYGVQKETRGGGVLDNDTDDQFLIPEDLRTPDNVDLLDTLRKFNSNGLPTGIIDVITKTNFKNQIELYEFYKANNIDVSFNPVFHTDRTLKNDLELDVDAFVNEFLKYFQHWLYDANGVSERDALEALRMVIGAGSKCCKNVDCRFRWLCVNPIGDIYPCDRYISDKYIVGNIFKTDKIIDVFKSDAYINYTNEISERVNTHCKECGYLQYCNGGCNCTSFEASGSMKGVDKHYCEIFRRKFKGVYNIVKDISLSNPSLNKAARKVLIECNFYSLTEIKQFLKDEGFDIDLEYDDTDLLNCSEFSFFSNINYFKELYNDMGVYLTSDDIRNIEHMEQINKSGLSSKYMTKGHTDVCISKDEIYENNIIRKNDLKTLVYTIIEQIRKREGKEAS